MGAAWWLFDVTPERFERVAEKGDDPRVRADLALAYVGAYRIDDALRHIEGLPRERAEPLLELIQLVQRVERTNDRAGDVLRLAAQWRAVGRYDLVEDLLRSTTSIADPPYRHLLLAQVLVARLRPQEAIEVLETSGSLDTPPLALLLAALYADEDRFAEAIGLLESVRASGPVGTLVKDRLEHIRAEHSRLLEALR